MKVAVVGAGIIGCAIAHELASRGAKVSVFDRRGVARGASWASAGVLAPWIEAHDRGPLLEMCAESLEMYDAFVERVRADAGATFEYARRGTLEIAFNEKQFRALQRSAESLSASGVGADLLDAAGARGLEPGVSGRVVGGLHVHGHGFVEMPALVEALAVAARMRGAAFHAPADITKIEQAPGGAVRLHLPGGPQTFDHIVVAAGSWADRLKTGAESVKPVKGQLVRLRFESPPATRVLWSEDVYLVPWRDGTLLAGATMEDAGFDERPTAEAAASLVEAAAALLPAARHAEFVDIRAGLRPALESGGGRPFIGPSPFLRGVTVAGGHFRNGVLLAPLTAARVAHQVFGESDVQTE
jgi:glycine oxidase